MPKMTKKKMRKWIAQLQEVLKGTRNEVMVHEGKVRGPIAFSLTKDKNQNVRLSCAESLRETFSKGSPDPQYFQLVTPAVLRGLEDPYDEVPCFANSSEENLEQFCFRNSVKSTLMSIES